MQLLKIIILLLAFPVLAGAQDSKLAQQYFSNGEFEKASVVYQELYEKNKGNDYYFNKYITCLLNLNEFATAEKAIKKEIKKKPKDVQLYVTYGNLFEQQLKDVEAEEQYQKAIKKLSAEKFAITKLANAFSNLMKYDKAIETYEKGTKLLKEDYMFAYNLGDLYRLKGNNSKMITNYLNSLIETPSRLNSMKTIFQRYLHEEDFLELQTQLYERIQEDDKATYYPELLTWVFIQKKDYKNALRQSKALDRQLNENGNRVFRLAQISAQAKQYDVAIDAYDYIIQEKDPSSTFYINAKREALNCEKEKLVEGFDYTKDDLLVLEQKYEVFLDEFGRSKTTGSIIAELAKLEAFYLNDLDKAIGLLKEMIDYPGLDRILKAKSKLSLADFYLMQGEIWESTLLYSQVDKAFKDDILGHEARYRNAKLSYYSGDFQWAQAQFDILKASTSKLIANNALDLSIFIMDNLGLDTSATAIQLYAESDLLVFQNRFDEAFNKLDTLERNFKDHSLKDDLYYIKSKIYYKQKDFVQTAKMLQKIIDDHGDDIRADNALFELATLYENQLNDPEKAKGLYETIFIDYSGSTFAVEARKRFRQLRGDDI